MIFVAEANGGEEQRTRCVVKFASQYGKEAHEFMYECGVAARLMYCQGGDSRWLLHRRHGVHRRGRERQSVASWGREARGRTGGAAQRKEPGLQRPSLGQRTD